MKNGSKLARSTASSPHLLGELPRRAGIAASRRVGLPLGVQARVGRRAVHRRGGDELAVRVRDEHRDGTRRLRDDELDDGAGALEFTASSRSYSYARTGSMSAHAAPAPGGRRSSIRGTPYPVVLPEAERSPPAPGRGDHLAAGDRADRVPLPGLDRADPDLAADLRACSRSRSRSRQQHVLMWPASAMLTGNGVAFILRVPGTRHGDWWSLAAGGSSSAPRRSRCSRST